MLADLKKQWKERSIRKLAYMTQGKLHFEPINFAEYEKSCTRTEMPNKFKKVGSPKVIAEEVFDYTQYEQSKSTRTSPKSSKSYSTTMLNKSSKKPFYYVRNNEIMSLDQFFELYQSAVGQQKLKEKFDNKYKLEEKKKKIEEIHKRNQRLMKHAISANNSLIIQPDKLDLKTDYSVNVPTPAAVQRMDLSQQISEETPYIDPRPARQIKFSPRLEEKTFSPNERVSVPGSIIRHRTGSLDEGCQRGMTADQKFTEREIYKHLVRMTVSPKPVRNASDKKNSKERVYASMFKDPKMMDCMVENSIKRAQHIIVKKNQGAVQSYRLPTNKSDGVNYRVDSISEIESKDHEREGEINGQEFAVMNLKEDSKKNSIAIAKKIKVNIKHIDSLLRAKSPREKDLKSPKLLNRTIIMDVKSKNKFPLRSTVAQRYNFGEKLLDQRKIAGQIKEVSKSYRKDAVDSAIKSQTYVSYYN